MDENPDGEMKKMLSKSTKVKLSYWMAFPVAIIIFAIGFGFGKGRLSLFNGISNNSSGSSTASKDLDFNSVQKLYDVLKSSYDGTLDTKMLNEGLKEGLARAVGDPYTEYFTVEKEQEFKDDLNGTFSGIGAELGREGDNIIIQSPISGAPAEKAGVKARDIIAEIDGESAYGISIEVAVKKIRGQKGTKVKLTLIRNGSERVVLEIVRDQITIPSVTNKILDGNIGYMQISRFAEDTYALSQKAADDFKSKNVKSIVLDLRNNPGGYLDQAVKVSGLWLDKGTLVVDERRGDKTVQTFKSAGPATLKGIKTIILVNGGSASASEITAGALKDAGVATLYGEKTYGKGVVQEIKQLGATLLGDNTEGALKVTIAKWYTPKGQNINKEGISPDKQVEISADDAKAGKDTQLDAALSALK